MSQNRRPVPAPRSAAAETTATSGPDQTRLALVRAGLALFGKNGFEATTTREISAAAKANIGSIAYHFGGKEGLHAACAAHIVETIKGIAGPVIAGMPDTGRLPPDAAAAFLSGALERMADFVVSRPEAGEIVSFILRELNRPTAALNTIYFGVFEPLHKQLCAIWAAATGDEADSERTKIQVFTLIGQVVYFRIGREAVLRRMGWKTIGRGEADAVTAVARDNLAAIIAARREAKP